MLLGGVIFTSTFFVTEGVTIGLTVALTSGLDSVLVEVGNLPRMRVNTAPLESLGNWYSTIISVASYEPTGNTAALEIL